MFDQLHRPRELGPQDQGPRKRIAIIGAGISGLSAAYYLSARHHVTLFEAAPRLGGHARTVMAGRSGQQPVDTGFIVFNYATYPYLTTLFDALNVPVAKSEMSFGATIDNGRLEYGLNTLGTLTAQKRNLLRPAYYRMIADILRFGRSAEAAATTDEMTIAELVRQLGLSDGFRDDYLLPMCGAIWSTPMHEIDQFPARSLVRFFRNHALLAGSQKHQWWTVDGGSIEYVRRIETVLKGRDCQIHLASPVQALERDDFGVSLYVNGDWSSRFDEVILACHSDQSRKILGNNATPQEARALGSIRYQTNRAVLHCDPTQMPQRRSCWSSWVYRSQSGRIGVTYWMNRLQNIPESDPLFVSLNPTSPIAQDEIYDEVSFDHPVFDRAAMAAQQDLQAIQGQNRSWYAGAYCRYGFHEDGIASAMDVVRAIDPMAAPDASQSPAAPVAALS